MHRSDLKVKITSVENVLKMRKIYLHDTQGETHEGDLDRLVKEECGDWIFRLIEEGEEPNPAGVCLGPPGPKFIQGSSGGSAEP